MHDGIVPNEHIVPNVDGYITHDVNRRVLLDVRIRADRNRLKIAAHHSAEPYARAGANRHVSDDSRRRRNECGRINHGSLAPIGQDDLIHQHTPPLTLLRCIIPRLFILQQEFFQYSYALFAQPNSNLRTCEIRRSGAPRDGLHRAERRRTVRKIGGQ